MHGMQRVFSMGEGFHYFPSEKTRQLDLVGTLLRKNVNPREISLSVRKFMHRMQWVLPLL